MNSDYIDLDNEFVNLNTSKNLLDSATYRLQCTAAGRNADFLDSSASVCIVISDVEPVDLVVAMKAAVILMPNGLSYNYKVKDGYDAWAFAPYGESSLSITPVRMP